MTGDKRTEYRRIAEKRVNKVLDELDKIGSMGYRDYYDYSDKDVERIYKAISERLEDMRNSLLQRKRPGSFRLDV